MYNCQFCVGPNPVSFFVCPSLSSSFSCTLSSLWVRVCVSVCVCVIFRVCVCVRLHPPSFLPALLPLFCNVWETSILLSAKKCFFFFQIHCTFKTSVWTGFPAPDCRRPASGGRRKPGVPLLGNERGFLSGGRRRRAGTPSPRRRPRWSHRRRPYCRCCWPPCYCSPPRRRRLDASVAQSCPSPTIHPSPWVSIWRGPSPTSPKRSTSSPSPCRSASGKPRNALSPMRFSRTQLTEQ